MWKLEGADIFTSPSGLNRGGRAEEPVILDSHQPRHRAPDAEIAVSSRPEHGVLVVSVTGAATPEVFSTVTCHLMPVLDRQAVVVDISALTLAGGATVNQLPSLFTSFAESARRVCLVCGRLTARKLLRHIGVLDVMPVFMTVEDAVQALLLQRNGHGDGWERRVDWQRQR